MSHQTSWQSASWSSVISAHHTLYIFGRNLLFKLYYRLWHELFCRYENSFSIASKRLVHPLKRKLSLLILMSVQTRRTLCLQTEMFNRLMLLFFMKRKSMWTRKSTIKVSESIQHFNTSSEATQWFCVMNGHISSAKRHLFLRLVTLWYDVIRSEYSAWINYDTALFSSL